MVVRQVLREQHLSATRPTDAARSPDSCSRARGPSRRNPGLTLTFGEVAYPHINAKAVRVLRDRKLGAPESGNARVKALRQVFAWAMAEDVGGVERTRRGTSTYLKGQARRLPFVDPHRGRAIRSTPSHRHEGAARDGAAAVHGPAALGCGAVRPSARARRLAALHPAKNRRSKPVTLELPVLPVLQSDHRRYADRRHDLPAHGVRASPSRPRASATGFGDGVMRPGSPQCSAMVCERLAR